jgi:hypothetical protein
MVFAEQIMSPETTPMRVIREINWKTLFFELVIVFIGLLAALQVDDYRDRRAFEVAQTRYLERLRDDLAAYLGQTESTVEFLNDTRDAVDHIWASIEAGEIIDGNIEQFEHGLIYMGHLPSNPLPRGAYDEMVASGMFSALQSNELQRAISQLFSTHDFVETNFSWWRDSFLHTERYVFGLLQFSYGEGEAVLMNDTLAEPKRHVSFDFDQLAGDMKFRNGIYWARDVRSDWVEWVTELRTQSEQVRRLLVDALEG